MQDPTVAERRLLDKQTRERIRQQEQALISGDKERANAFRQQQHASQALELEAYRKANPNTVADPDIDTECLDLTTAHNQIPAHLLDYIQANKLEQAWITLESQRKASRKYYHSHKEKARQRYQLKKAETAELRAQIKLLAAESTKVKIQANDQAKLDLVILKQRTAEAAALAAAQLKEAKALQIQLDQESKKANKAASKQAAARANELPAYTVAADRYELFHQKLTEYTPGYLANTLTPEELAMFQRGLAEFNKIPQYFIREHMIDAPKPWEVTPDDDLQ